MASGSARSASTRALIAAILTISLVGVGLTIVGPLISLRLEKADYAASLNGLSMCLAGLGNIALLPMAPKLLRLLGARALINVGLLAAAVVLLIGAGIAHPVGLIALRLGFSVILGLLFTLSEYVVSTLSPLDRRGFWLGLYVASLGLGFFIGPLALSVLGIEGPAPFYAAALCVLAAIAPISLCAGNIGNIGEQSQSSPFLRVIASAPDLMLGAFVFGAIENSALILTPIYGVRNGLDIQAGALLAGCIALGYVIFQLPIGFIADRAPRTLVLIAICLVGAVGALVAPFLRSHALGLGLLLIVWGGVASAIYPVALTELVARTDDPQRAGANAALVLCYSLGMAAGPPVLGLALDVAPRFGFFFVLAAILAAYALTLVLRKS